jgi:hypothetical protein
VVSTSAPRRLIVMPLPMRPRVKSTTSSTSAAMRLALRRMRSATGRDSGSGCFRASSSAPSRIAPSGVRRSWPRPAMNCSRNSSKPFLSDIPVIVLSNSRNEVDRMRTRVLGAA